MSTAITKQGGGWAIAPANMTELYRFAELLAASDLVPKDYKEKPGNCMVAIQMGGELGLSPMQSIQNIAVINGRPSLWGDALLAVCLPHLDQFDETDDGATATCTAKRGNRTVTTTFSTEDAKRAGLAGKQGPWSQYPARMRKMRARGFTLRDICADVLRGVHSAEEVQDIPREVRAEVVSSKTVEEPKTEPKQEERNSTPPAAAEGPTFAESWPDKAWAGRPLQGAPGNVLSDYAAWVSAILEDPKRARLHKKAQQSLEDVEAELDRLLAEEAERAMTGSSAPAEPDPVAVKLQQQIDARGTQPGDDLADGWGLSSP